MITLILDAAYNLEVTILNDNDIVTEKKSEEKVADRFMLLIDEALKESKLSFEDINQMMINIGPGSFTGLRVAVSVIKGLSFNKKIDVYTYDTFDYVDDHIDKTIVLPAF